MGENVSRRGFVQGLGAVAGLGALGVSAGAAIADEPAVQADAVPGYSPFAEYDLFAESRVVREDIPEDQIEATYDYDVVVIGAGTAGITAAFTAADKGGVKVACLQNAATAISQGNMGSGLVLDESTEYGLARFIHDWNENNIYASDYFMVENYVKYSGYAADKVLGLAQEAGYYEDRILVMPDVIDYGDGEKVTSKRVLFIDKPYTYGDAMDWIAQHIAADHGVDFYFSMPGVKLIQDGDGRVVAAIGLNEDTGKYARFNASRGVILACGSFINNQAMLARYCTQGLGYTAKVSGRYGDGHLMGLLAGGVLRNGGYSKMCHDNDTGPLADIPFLAVNYDGKRFINEEVASTWWCNISANAKEKGRYFRIFDSNYPAVCEALGVSVPSDDKMAGYMPGTEQSNAKGAYGFFSATYKADTLEELAEQVGLPADELAATVERYNQIVASGKDTDFGKQSKYLFPIDTPPYWCTNTWSRLSTILQGLNIDKYQRVVDVEGDPIPGLYAAGNCSGTPGGQSDWTQVSLGESLGFAFTEGYVAGSHIVDALEE